MLDDVTVVMKIIVFLYDDLPQEKDGKQIGNKIKRRMLACSTFFIQKLIEYVTASHNKIAVPFMNGLSSCVNDSVKDKESKVGNTAGNSTT